MQHVAIAYVLIFGVVAGYIVNLQRRMQAIKRERQRIESKNREA